MSREQDTLPQLRLPRGPTTLAWTLPIVASMNSYRFPDVSFGNGETWISAITLLPSLALPRSGWRVVRLAGR